MSFWEKWMLAGGVVAALVSWNNRRALTWLALGVADYLFTSAWADLNWPLHPFITAMTDAAVCGTIYVVCKRYGGQRWELGVYTAFWLSVIVGFGRLAGNVSATLYPLLLEAANWLAILTIVGSGTLRLADVWGSNLGGAGHNRGRLHRLVRAAFAPTRVSPFWWARGWFPPVPS